MPYWQVFISDGVLSDVVGTGLSQNSMQVATVKVKQPRYRPGVAQRVPGS
jgi:hypothetical protein